MKLALKLLDMIKSRTLIIDPVLEYSTHCGEARPMMSRPALPSMIVGMRILQVQRYRRLFQLTNALQANLIRYGG